MSNITLYLFSAFWGLFIGYDVIPHTSTLPKRELVSRVDTLRNASKWPEDLILTNFSSSDLTPSPACIAVAASGGCHVSDGRNKR